LWAEVERFRALASGHMQIGSKGIVTAGLTVSIAVIIAPLLYTLIVPPIIEILDFGKKAREARAERKRVPG
jgi:hypothetical protein